MNYAHFINGEFKGYINRVPASASVTVKGYVEHDQHRIHQYIQVSEKKISRLRLSMR
jgi:hypothetical protein